MDRTTPPGAWPGTSVVACQNTASCPGAFYTLHDTSSQDFRVGLRWLFPAGGGIGLFPVAQAAFAPQQQYLLRRGLWRPGISDNRPGRCGRQVLSALRIMPVAPPTFRVVPPAPIYRWGGVYGGVPGGYSGSAINLGTAQAPIAFILRETAIEQDQQISHWPVFDAASSATSGSVGGFIGYNSEWENALILGVELNYNHVAIGVVE
jgi:hypothetical protein